MVDLTPVRTHTCSSNIFWQVQFTGSHGANYVLTYEGSIGWSCTCPGYKYRGDCKHIHDKELAGKRCGWGEDAFANAVHDETECPECGSPTTSFYIGT
jgi:hypothetical protein